MTYVKMFDRLLELAETETGWSENSEEYNDLYDRLMCVLISADIESESGQR